MGAAAGGSALADDGQSALKAGASFDDHGGNGLAAGIGDQFRGFYWDFGGTTGMKLPSMAELKPYKPYIIGGVAMLLSAGALALVLMNHGAGARPGSQANLAIPVAAKKPQTRARGAETGPLKHMQLQAQYAGPLKDTLIQRWRDPVDGTICYVYLPILVQHSPRTKLGLVQYGANSIGSISCMRGR